MSVHLRILGSIQDGRLSGRACNAVIACSGFGEFVETPMMTGIMVVNAARDAVRETHLRLGDSTSLSSKEHDFLQCIASARPTTAP